MSDTITENTSIPEAAPRRLVRVDDGRWLGGVAAGLGRYFDVNPLVYRIAFAALALAGGTGVFLYLAAWLVMPSERSDESIAVEALRRHRDRPWLLLGVGLLAFGALLALSEASFWPGTGNVWLAALLIGAAVVWWHVANRDDAPRATTTDAPGPPTPPAPRKQSLFAPVLGALLAAAGLLGLLSVLDVYDVELAVALAGGLAVVGAAIAVGALTQRRVGGLVFLGLALLAAFAGAAATPVSISSGIGEKVERPLAAGSVDRSYELGVGELDLDLTAVSFPSGTTSIDASVGVGQLLITVPANVALEIDAETGVGDVNVLGERDDGVNADVRRSVPGSTPAAPVLEIEADVGFGEIVVQRG